RNGGLPMSVALSLETELALSSLFNILLPKKAVKLDDYLDVELLLLAIIKAFQNNFPEFNDWDQRCILCIRLIGLILSVSIPETAEIFCESLHDVATALKEGKEIEISEPAKLHKMKNTYLERTDVGFYRSARESRFGLGFDFSCGMHGQMCFMRTGEAEANVRAYTRSGEEFLGRTMLNKSNKFSAKRTADEWYQVACLFENKRAVLYLEKAIARDYKHVPSLIKLAEIYFLGDGVEVNLDRANTLYLEAALCRDEKSKIALFNLFSIAYEQLTEDAQWYEIGRCFDCNKNYSLANRCFQKAIHINPSHLSALFFLGMNYKSGAGVTADVDAAKDFFERCGSDAAIEQLHQHLTR
ncbi:MAG TPA: hypothetical protein VIJ14_08735, partial [Rhabdochlamydiaceae bacterium]